MRQIIVRQMKFQTVISCFYRSDCCLSIASDHFLDLLLCNSRQCIWSKIHIRNHKHLCFWIHGSCDRTLPELDPCFPPILMDRIGQFPVPFDQMIFTDRYKMCRSTRGMYCCNLYNIQRTASFCPCRVISDQLVCHRSVLICHSRPHCRQDNSVFQLHIPNLDGSKYVFKHLVIPPRFAFIIGQPRRNRYAYFPI